MEPVHREDPDGIQLQETADVRHGPDSKDAQRHRLGARLLLPDGHLAILKPVGVQKRGARDQGQLPVPAAAALFRRLAELSHARHALLSGHPDRTRLLHHQAVRQVCLLP